MLFLNKPVAYLQNDDFDLAGNIVNPDIPKNTPVIIGIFANFCGFCTQAKPAFQKFADDYEGKVFVATIQGDGSLPGEKELGSRLKMISPTFRGFPDYVLYVNGKRVQRNIKGRGYDDLVEFAKLN